MTKLFDRTEKAFEPFFDSRVSVRGEHGGHRIQTGPIPACVFDQGLDDPLSEENVSTNRRRYSLVIPKSAWCDLVPPAVGFEVTLEDGTKVKVTSSGLVGGDFALEAR